MTTPGKALGSPLDKYSRPPLPPKVHAAVRAWVLAASWASAARKNVPLAVANCGAWIDDMIDTVRMHNLAPKLLNDHPETVSLMESWINHEIDGRVLKHAVLSSARAQGIADHQFDWPLLNMWIDAAYLRLCARYTAGSFYRWPDLNGGMATAFADLGIPAADLRQRVKT